MGNCGNSSAYKDFIDYFNDISILGLYLFIFYGRKRLFTIVYLSVQGFSSLWCLSIGTLKINIIEKTKLAIMPLIFSPL